MAQISFWGFDNGTADDTSAANGAQDGAFQNGASATFGALELDGSTQYVEVAPDTAFQLSSGTLITEFTAATQHTGAVFSRDSLNNDDGGHFYLRVTGDGRVETRAQAGDGTNTVLNTGTNFYAAGDTIRAVYSWDEGTGGTFSVENLTQATSFSTSVPAIVTWDQNTFNEPITIGANQNQSGDNIADNLQQYFNGTIDYVSLHDTTETFATSGLGGDGVVSGTGGDDLIDAAYLGDPDAEQVDNGDGIFATTGDQDIIKSGAGNDTVSSGADSDTVNAGLDDDSVDGGAGNDMLFGDVISSGMEGLSVTSLQLNIADVRAGTQTGAPDAAVEGDSVIYDNVGFLDDGTAVSARITLLSRTNENLTVDLVGLSGAEIITNRTNDPAMEGEKASFGIEFLNSATDAPIVLTGRATWGDIDEAVGGAEAITISDEQFLGYETAAVNQLALSQTNGEYTAAGASGGTNLDPSDQTAWFTGLFEDQSELEFTITTRGANSGFTLNGDVIDNATTVLFEQGDDTLNGDAGDDTLVGNGGADLLIGGSGDDSIFGGTENDTIWGDQADPTGANLTVGDDTLDGGAGDDVLYGERGDDVLNGGDGEDALQGGAGNDDLSGEAGNDRLIGGSGADRMRGGAGNDTILADDDATGGAAGASDPNFGDVIEGNEGSDVIYANGSDTVDGGEDLDGSDIDILNLSNVASIQYQNGAGANVAGPTENGVVTFNDGSTLQFSNIETIALPAADGYVEGTTADDLIDAGYLSDPELDQIDNGDAVFAGEAPDDDIVLAGDGDDTVIAAAGDDVIFGDRQQAPANPDGSGGTGTTDPWQFEYYDLDPTGNPSNLANAGFTLNGGRDHSGTPTSTGAASTITPADYDTADDFALKFTTELVVDQAGLYTFSTSSDDGSKLFIDGVEIVDNDGLHALETQTGFIGLTPGVHLVEIIYFENDGGNQLTSTISGPDTGGTAVDLATYPAIINPALNTGSGDDVLAGGAGNDQIFGEGGDDRIVLEDGFGQDFILGGESGETDGDSLDASAMTQRVRLILDSDEGGEIYNEFTDISDFDEIERFFTGSGDDTVVATAATNGTVADTGAGADVVQAGDGADVFDTGSGNDTVTTGDGGDVVDAGTGADSVASGTGDDLHFGGDGDDTLEGGAGADTLLGGADSDSLTGGAGDDVLTGGTYESVSFNQSGNDGLANAGPISDFPDDALSFELRFSGDPGTQNSSPLVSYATPANNNAFLVFMAGGTVRIYINDATIDTGVSASSLFDGTTHSFGVTWDSASGALTTYVDGVETSTDTFQQGATIASGGTLVFGQEQDSPGGGFSTAQLFEGQFEEARLWGDVRTADEIAEFEAGPLGVELANPDLISDWLPSADGTALDDIAGPNDAPLTGDATAIVAAGDTADTLIGGTGNDTMLGMDGDDSFVLADGHGTDTITGGEAGETAGDRIDATTMTQASTLTFSADEAGTLTHSGGAAGFSEIENFQLGSGADTIDATADSLGTNVDGGAGNDIFASGAGADTLAGGDDADTFTFDTPADAYGDSIDGGDGGTDNDTLDLSGTLSPGGTYTLVTTGPDSDGNGTDGQVNFFDAGGVLEGTLTFTNIEAIVPCFTTGTRIATQRGGIAVENLQVGDMVKTRDNGLQPIRWIGTKTLNADALRAQPSLRPVLLRKGALGNGVPLRDMTVSPQHRFLLDNVQVQLNFGVEGALGTAKHMQCLNGIETNMQSEVTYYHILFDHHQLVLSDGAWSESFQPGERTLSGLEDGPRAELYVLFPELFDTELPASYPAARPTLSSYEVPMAFC
ncbi:Hint domain-containing protein [uncultured Sulfitobacter sp.]|uniref:Hint domain-containing protein n=1 Tax=uncultured Sulfitobacter sp. TaxID=191468 RepID=UPI00261C23D7|nr:Hint domain-containing protein [uncultured Sulfitobacter sp.]